MCKSKRQPSSLLRLLHLTGQTDWPPTIFDRHLSSLEITRVRAYRMVQLFLRCSNIHFLTSHVDSIISNNNHAIRSHSCYFKRWKRWRSKIIDCQSVWPVKCNKLTYCNATCEVQALLHHLFLHNHNENSYHNHCWHGFTITI